MLIGPKGSGKTYIGSLVGKHSDIHFLRVESVWVTLQPGENGWEKVKTTIAEAFQTHPKVMIESLGAGEEFHSFLASLKKSYQVKMIRVYADLDLCLKRVHERDAHEHIPVSDEQLMGYNTIASQVEFDWALEINNSGITPAMEIINTIKQLEEHISHG